MIQIDKALLDELFAKAEASDRKRMNYDLRTSAEDKSQRMLNALLPGTVVPVHRHPMSNENVILLCGKLVEILYEEGEITQEEELVLSLASPEALEGKETLMCKNTLRETARYTLDPSAGAYGCIVPAGVWYFDIIIL